MCSLVTGGNGSAIIPSGGLFVASSSSKMAGIFAAYSHLAF